MIIELPNGQELEFPDDTSQEVMRSAIAKRFPEYAQKETKKEEAYKMPDWRDTFKEALRQREASIGARPEVAAARETPEGKLLELPLFLAAPEAEIPALGSALARLLPRAGKYLTSGIQTAIPQAALAGGSAALSEEESPLQSATIAGGIAAPFSTLSGLISSGSPVARAIGRGTAMLGGGVTGYEASHALGGNPLESAGAIGAGVLLPAAVWKGLRPTQGVEKKVINKWFENVFPEKDLPKIEEAYNKAYASEGKIPEDIFGLKDNKIFQEAEKKMLNEPVYQENLIGVPENSIQYLDYVKRKLWGLEQADKKAAGDLASGYRETRQKLSKELGELSPEYKEANELFERRAARKQIEDGFFNSREMSGKNFAKYLDNKKNYKELQKGLRNVPDAAKQVEEMKKVFDKLKTITPPHDFEKINVLNDLLKTYKYDKAMTELASNPVWKGELDDLLKISKKEKFISGVMDLIAKANLQKQISD